MFALNISPDYRRALPVPADRIRVICERPVNVPLRLSVPKADVPKRPVFGKRR